MKFQNRFASGGLVKAVDILGDNGFQFAPGFQFCQLMMGRIGFCVQEQHFIAVKTVKFAGIATVKRVAQNGFRGIIILLVIKSIHTAELRNAAFRGYSRTAEKNYIAVFAYYFF